MRRVLLMLTVALVMVVMLAVSASATFAQPEPITGGGAKDRGAVVDHEPDCTLNGVDTSDTCTLIQSPSGNDTAVNQNKDASRRDSANVNHEAPNCFINNALADDCHLTQSAGGKENLIIQNHPHKKN